MRHRFMLQVCVSALVLSSCAFAVTYGSHIRGKIQGAWVQYCNNDSIVVTSGYGECAGKYWKISTPDTVGLSAAVLPSGTDSNYVYIYIDDSVSSYPIPTIIGDTSEPVFVDSLCGWYHGNDRCIGAVWSPGGDSIECFVGNEEAYITKVNPIAKPVDDANPTGSWIAFDTTGRYTPVIATAAHLYVYCKDLGAYCQLFVQTYPNYRNQVGGSGYNANSWYSWLEFRPGYRGFQWNGNDDDDNEAKVWINGYRAQR